MAGDDLAVHELPGGKELWRWQGSVDKMIFRYREPSSALVGIPLSHRFRAKTVPAAWFGEPEPVEIRDAASGRVSFSHWLPPPLSPEVDFSDNGRHVVVAEPTQGEDGSFVAFLKKWLPEGWFAQSDLHTYQLAVFDLDEPALLFEGELRLQHNARGFQISNDGRSLLVDHEPAHSHTRTIECWDIPFARPWGWIIGVPAGIGVGAISWRRLRWRKWKRLNAALPLLADGKSG